MAPRSRTGCLTCRGRKLKCSEERPVCTQCAKANRECIPASGITFRHQQNPSMNSEQQGEGSLKNFYGYKESFGRNATWVEVPSELTFVHTNNPFEDAPDGPGGNAGYNEGDTSLMMGDTEHHDGMQDASELELAHAAYPMYATHGLEALSAVASRNQYNYVAPPASMSPPTHTTRQRSSFGSQPAPVAPSQNIDYILNPASVAASSPTMSNLDPQLQSESPAHRHSLPSPEASLHNLDNVRRKSYSSSHRPPSLLSKGSNCGSDRRAAITDPELAFFLRDFAERMGLWMDIFGEELFFSGHVPVLAATCPLLSYSCAALSAKALARVNGRKPIMGGQVIATGQSQIENWPGLPMSAETWLHRARQYYDLAVSLLRQALSGASRPPANSLPEEATPATVLNVQGYPLPSTDSEELVAATAILCVYEFFDVSGAEWNRHLDGAKSLFDIANDRMHDLTRPPSPAAAVTNDQIAHHLAAIVSPRPCLSMGRRSVFWCFARQDMLFAFINNQPTRVDASDLAIWRSAGLKIAPNGITYPSNPLHPEFRAEDAMSDDMQGNALIWLLAKLVNLVVAPPRGQDDLSPRSLTVQQTEAAENWEELDAQLQAWYEGLTNNFTPAAIYRSQAPLAIEEKWFPKSKCASTMQWWHFAKIQMLHHRPPSATSGDRKSSNAAFEVTMPGISLAQRHASFASILRQSRDHAKEIVSIGLGRADEGCRVHAVQPLWTAGLVLGNSEDDHIDPETIMWRCSIIRQLRGIEKDTGWASEYRVQSLLQLWRLPPDWNPG